MAIDTATKRFSMMGLGNPVFKYVVPSGAIGAPGRATYLDLYSGIALDPPSAIVAICFEGFDGELTDSEGFQGKLTTIMGFSGTLTDNQAFTGILISTEGFSGKMTDSDGFVGKLTDIEGFKGTLCD